MSDKRIKVIRILFISLVITACSDDSGTNNIGNASQPATVNKIQVSVDPCDLALAPQTGPDPGDSRIARYQQAVLRGHHPVESLERLGWAYIDKARNRFDPGFYKLAESSALCIDDRQPGRPESLLLRGHVLHSLHRFSEAEDIARTLTAMRGHWLDHGLLGDVLMEQGKLVEAIAAYQAMMDQRPGPQAYSRAAHIRWLTGDLEGAIGMMRPAVRGLSSRDAGSAAWALVRLANYQLQANDSRSAENSIARALEIQPDYPPALLVMGRSLLAQKQYNQAIEILTRAVLGNPLPEYQWVLIEAFQAAGLRQDAMKIETDLMKSGALEDRRTYALYLASYGKDIPMAMRLIEAELRDRKDVITLDAAAWIYHAAGRLQDAQTYSRLSLSEGTLDAQLLYHAGVIATASGEYPRADHLLRQAIQLQHMLLPSERIRLAKEFATLQSQYTALVEEQGVHQDQTLPI